MSPPIRIGRTTEISSALPIVAALPKAAPAQAALRRGPAAASETNARQAWVPSLSRQALLTQSPGDNQLVSWTSRRSAPPRSTLSRSSAKAATSESSGNMTLTDRRSHACASAAMPVRTRRQGSRHATQQTRYSPIPRPVRQSRELTPLGHRPDLFGPLRRRQKRSRPLGPRHDEGDRRPPVSAPLNYRAAADDRFQHPRTAEVDDRFGDISIVPSSTQAAVGAGDSSASEGARSIIRVCGQGHPPCADRVRLARSSGCEKLPCHVPRSKQSPANALALGDPGSLGKPPEENRS